MKKNVGTIAGLFLATVLLLGTGYLSLMYYYRNTFPAFLWIDDIYSTGKTIDEINEELLQKYPYYGIKVIDDSGAELIINAYEIDLQSDFTSDLRIIQELRGGANWWQGLYGSKNFTANRTVSFDEDKLKNILENWEAFPSVEDIEVKIIDTDEGYELRDTADHFPLVDKIVFAVTNGVYRLEKEINLAEDNEYSINGTFYYDAATNEQIHTRELFKKIDELQNRDYYLDFNGEKIAIGKEKLSELILTSGEYLERKNEPLEEEISKSQKKKKIIPGDGRYIVKGVVLDEKDLPEDYFHEDNGFMVDAEGNPAISEAKLYDYSLYLSKTYDTEWFMDRYKKGLGSVIFINEQKTGRGQLIDPDDEFAKLERMFAEVTTESGSEKSDEIDADNVLSLLPGVKSYDASEKLGKTFIEVNMDKQELKYYVDSELSMEMPVVTGNINRGRGTPAGIFDVYNKRYHTYLRGVGYVSYVNYWLGVHKGVGIHDANWRSEFGEEIYKSDGSHGCINCPEEKVFPLWEVVEVGTPVILYY
jgi:hypothetical protein